MNGIAKHTPAPWLLELMSGVPTAFGVGIAEPRAMSTRKNAIKQVSFILKSFPQNVTISEF